MIWYECFLFSFHHLIYFSILPVESTLSRYEIDAPSKTVFIYFWEIIAPLFKFDFPTHLPQCAYSIPPNLNPYTVTRLYKMKIKNKIKNLPAGYNFMKINYDNLVIFLCGLNSIFLVKKTFTKKGG